MNNNCKVCGNQMQKYLGLNMREPEVFCEYCEANEGPDDDGDDTLDLKLPDWEGYKTWLDLNPSATIVEYREARKRFGYCDGAWSTLMGYEIWQDRLEQQLDYVMSWAIPTQDEPDRVPSEEQAKQASSQKPRKYVQLELPFPTDD